MILTSSQWSLVHILLCKPGILQPTLEGRGSSHCAFQGFGRLGGCHLRDSESGAVDSLRAGGCFSTVLKRLWSNGGLWWCGDAAHLLCFFVFSSLVFLVLKENVFFIFLITTICSFLLHMITHKICHVSFCFRYFCVAVFCSSCHTIVPQLPWFLFAPPLYLPMDQNPGTLLFTPRYFGFMDAHPSVMWYFIGVDHVWSIIMSTLDSLDCSIGSYSSSSQPSPIKPTKGHHGVYWSGDWRYLVLLFWTILGMIGWDDEPTSDSFPGFAEPMFVLIPLVESTI